MIEQILRTGATKIVMLFLPHYHDDFEIFITCRFFVGGSALYYASMNISIKLLQQSFSNIIQLHVIFINHDSIFAYGYVCCFSPE